MYLGGNGFYWRVAFSDAWPGAMELRRAEDGVRNWQTGDGESYHAFGGEYGGMWRATDDHQTRSRGRLRRPGIRPGDLLRRERASLDVAGGLDLGWCRPRRRPHRHLRTRRRRRRPGDRSLRHPARITRTRGRAGVGDRLRSRHGAHKGGVRRIGRRPFARPYVRGDIVFYETPGGGAVFSVGSISWFGALARNNFDNDVAQMTTNVIRRFLDPTPFEPPSA